MMGIHRVKKKLAPAFTKGASEDLWGTRVISGKIGLSLRFNGHFPGEPGLAGVY